ncbi:hypothetical protein [Bordetella avium]|nr:hypothetical protein [Bordetella avium]AZY49124.1 hypothetical protein C0J09_08165 [Bordetella avium]AZY52482.1 hypothetical protein C0J07_08150 [Bordetella avium]RIQ12275.1 hypothetical protein D0432_13565 [Bordetella avium]RIQ19353.1 hypothetical protein D0850_04720 [Bordetella avium]RIQ33522.1 hypothetical protein D0849_11410 [Bordetella avium]
MNLLFRSLFLAALLTLAACANYERAAMVRVDAGQGDRMVVLPRDVAVELSGDPGRVLPQDSRWRRIGAIAQGDVYRRLDGRFAVRSEGREREAYLVESGGRLIGFYLPAEGWFVKSATFQRMPTWR